MGVRIHQTNINRKGRGEDGKVPVEAQPTEDELRKVKPRTEASDKNR